jgi:very-short-patch-repair endonuclease
MAYSGTYRGKFRFRSLLELAAMIHFESEGYVLGETALYETVKIPYGKTRIRNYIVDFSLPELKTLVEIKPLSRTDNRNNRAKRLAAEAWCAQRGWTYVIVTEEELGVCRATILLEDAAKIGEVRLGERSLRALRRKDARKRRKLDRSRT